VKNIPDCPKRDRNRTATAYCSRMNSNTHELAKLRARFMELKTTLDGRIKENHESLIRIADLSYHIDRLLDKSKRHFITSRSQDKSLR
jgi:hypothetical protein